MEQSELAREIEAGESKVLELKEILPPSSEKYVKSLIAFANSSGGKLIVGVRDTDLKIVGVADAAQVADTIANAVSDLCEPIIAPRIRIEKLDELSIVVAEVQPGPSTPYHLKGRSLERGTYIRVGATTHPADDTTLRELSLRGAGQTYDEQPCLDTKFDEAEVTVLCDEMNARRKDNDHEVTENNLENWGLIRRMEGRRVPTRALLLLTSNPYQFARIQCAQFKGTDRVVFLDRREYGGPLYQQIDDAEDFVLRNIRLGARIKGLYREDRYELPREAVREAIVNAVVHRDLQSNACVQVALYDDRLEVTSPGTLYGGLTLEDALQGTSRLRNPRIAAALIQMDLFENWGTGLRRIQKACADAELPKPEFNELNSAFRVNIFRPRFDIPENLRGSDIDGSALSHGNNIETFLETLAPLGDGEKEVIRIAMERGRVTSSTLVKEAGMARRTAVRTLKNLAEREILEWHGRSTTDPLQYYTIERGSN